MGRTIIKSVYVGVIANIDPARSVRKKIFKAADVSVGFSLGKGPVANFIGLHMV
jgi:hypothetical protein